VAKQKQKTNGHLPKGFRDVGGQTIALEIGQSVMGIFGGARTIVQGAGKKKRESSIYNVTSADGEVSEFWGSAALDRMMARVQVGQEVYVVRIADAPKKKGQANSIKLFKVGVSGAPKKLAKRAKKDLLPARA
jgi:hypothetical protein